MPTGRLGRILTRLASLALALLYAWAAYVSAGWADVPYAVLYTFLPVISIWYPDYMGAFVARFRLTLHRGDCVPPVAVGIFAWTLLLLPLVTFPLAWLIDL